jgi:hypothetical protein
MENTTQKMKKIPFDLERAKKGEAFRMPFNNCDFFYLSNFGNQYHCKHRDHETGGWQASLYHNMDEWFHLIPDEPKQERWAVVIIKTIGLKEDADKKAEYLNRVIDGDEYTVVKLADNEV